MNIDVDLDIELYKKILSGKPKKFPNGYWQHADAKIKAQKLTKYMLENLLSWDKKDIVEKLSREIFAKYKLKGMLAIVCKDSYFELIDGIYPDTFKPWEFHYTYAGFWTLENSAIATRWMIEEKLKWNDTDIKEKLNRLTFKECGLGGMLFLLFNGNSFAVINNAYPDKFKPWEFARVSLDFWDSGKNIFEAINWVFKKECKTVDLNQINVLWFRNNQLHRLLRYYKGNVQKIINIYKNSATTISSNK